SCRPRAEARRPLLHGRQSRPALRADARAALRELRHACRQQQVPGDARPPPVAQEYPMTTAPPIKLFQFPRQFAIPNVSPFCCKMETWLRIAGISYEVVDTPNPRSAPKGKMPFIEDGGLRLGDSSLIIDHFKKTRGIDPDAHLDVQQRATALAI